MRKEYKLSHIYILCLTVCFSATSCDIVKSIKENFSGSKKEQVVTPQENPTASVKTVSQENKPLAKNELARIGSWSLTIEDFNQRLIALKEAFPEQDTTTNEFKKLFLDELVNQQLLVKDAEQKGVDTKEEIKKALEAVRMELLVREVANTLLKNVAVSDEDVQNFYNENKEQMIEPLQIRVSEIVVETQLKANEISIDLLKGADFDTIAQKNSISATADKGGDLGYLTEEPFQEMTNAILALDEGGISPVFSGPKGYYIIKLTEKKGGQPIALEEIKEDIKSNLLIMKQQQAIVDYIEQLKQKTKIEIQDSLL